jgi:hypothetical protein
VRGAYVVMDPAARLVLVPLAFASLLTGLIQSLGTVWGLFRHYWVLCKLLLTVVATIVLLAYMESFKAMADVAADPGADLSAVRNGTDGPLTVRFGGRRLFPVRGKEGVCAVLGCFGGSSPSVGVPRGLLLGGSHRGLDR